MEKNIKHDTVFASLNVNAERYTRDEDVVYDSLYRVGNQNTCVHCVLPALDFPAISSSQTITLSSTSEVKKSDCGLPCVNILAF